MQVETFEFGELVRDVCAELEETAHAKGLAFAVEIPEAPLTVNADPIRIAQVLRNLVENAVRHGEGIVTLTIGPLDGGAVITVSDQGAGIPEATATRVFTRFWRGGDRRGGTGLGLYIVKGLVEAHGGSVAVGRAEGGGAQFRFVLPAGTPSFLME